MVLWPFVHILSVNVGLPRPLLAGKREVLSAIAKTPVDGPVEVHRTNLEGDRQADPRVHGGPNKAVYVYPSEHYEYWREELGRDDLPWGSFGENLTTQGLLETDVRIGDQLRIGSAVFEVRSPRMPCFKLAAYLGVADMVKRFWSSRLSGLYLAVAATGMLNAGDTIEVLRTDPRFVTVDEVLRLWQDPLPARDRVQAALASPLAGSWRRDLEQRLTAD